MYRILALVVLALAVAPGGASAQTWDAPTLLSPYAGSGAGGYFVEPDAGDWGIVALWRRDGGVRLGLRGGLVEFGDDVRVVVGGELFGPLLSRGEGTLPLDVIWTAGAGAVLGDPTVLTLPVGLSIGTRLSLGGFAIAPYVAPRIAFDAVSGDEVDDSDLEFILDLGADLELGRRLTVLLGASLGGDGEFASHEALAIGISFRPTTGLAIR